MNDQPSADRYHYEVTAPVEQSPRRVVCLVPAMAETLIDLNVGDRLVGVTEDSLFPADLRFHMATVGSSDSPDWGAIEALSPDLIIADVRVNPAETIQRCRDGAVTTWIIDAPTVRETFNAIWTVMHIFDEGSMVERVRSIEWTCDWLERLDESRTTVCNTLLLRYQQHSWVALGQHPYTNDLLRVCGAKNSADHDREISLEAIAALNVDVILVLNDEHAPSAPLHELTSLPMRTVHHIHEIDPSLVFWQGTRIAYAFQVLPNVLCAHMDDTQNAEGREA
jgi:iron complex transport system substrate-binding protein